VCVGCVQKINLPPSQTVTWEARRIRSSWLHTRDIAYVFGGILRSIATITREDRDCCSEQAINGEEAHDRIAFAQ